jgi:hypothetical protein
MITYSWTINSLGSYPQYDGNQDVVIVIDATYTGTDGTYSSSVLVGQSLIINDSTVFTPYDDLTESQVLGWLLSAIPPQDIDQMQLKISAQIAADNQPTIVQLPLPWSN